MTSSVAVPSGEDKGVPEVATGVALAIIGMIEMMTIELSRNPELLQRRLFVQDDFCVIR